MKQYEYKSGNHGGNFHSMRDFLNLEGKDGWQLVAADFNGGYCTSYIMMREKVEEPARLPEGPS